ncbi:MAG: 2-C-methyl-D-erythritol 2,4-cyclodiphosphate synthase [Bacteroidales bacterium]|jgi:2-C-methyl-D-erythritol 2,4-cyclodiphosphate synthase|nr:2-C-methyl-D-erythritol 2,4-cyclodiphosphate synthase [Bacteroidales bacterium]
MPDSRFRTGYGYDAHKLVSGRTLVLGGVVIPYEKGLLGHSDADVLIHAVCDSLLGAAALGDIGKHFPDTSDEFAGIDSMVLLGKVVELLRSHGYETGNIDVTLRIQKPKIAPYIESMRARIAAVMNIAIDRISVKATTTEEMGFEGRGEGVSASAVALIYPNIFSS